MQALFCKGFPCQRISWMGQGSGIYDPPIIGHPTPVFAHAPPPTSVGPLELLIKATKCMTDDSGIPEHGNTARHDASSRLQMVASLACLSAPTNRLLRRLGVDRATNIRYCTRRYSTVRIFWGWLSPLRFRLAHEPVSESWIKRQFQYVPLRKPVPPQSMTNADWDARAWGLAIAAHSDAGLCPWGSGSLNSFVGHAYFCPSYLLLCFSRFLLF